MCHCCYHPTSHLTSMKKTKPPPKTSLKTRSSNRRPKFLSLQRQLSPENCPPMTPNPSENELHLFPLHPENLFGQFSREPEDKEIDENVAWFLDPEGSLSEGGTTINGLLGTSDEDLEPSMVYNYIGPEASRSNVAVAAALRHKARHGDEKWVVYSDVAAVAAVTENEEIKSKAEEEVSSAHFALTQPTKLSLKLDYEDILNAWSDKGPLYIEGECPQTVPDQDDRTNVFVDVGCARNVKLWSVPEDGCSAIEDGEGKMGQREARVMRYKEKRQSRLFSKRIRYEVRKLNAEKRPRMKGRFVKRKADV